MTPDSIRKTEGMASAAGALALRAGAWYLVSQLLIRGLTFLTTPVFTRLLSKAEYGIVRVYDSWLDMLLPVFGLCIYQSMARAKLDYEGEYYEYHSSVQALVLVFCAALAVILLVFRRTFEGLTGMNGLMTAVLLCFMPMSSVTAIWQNREKQLMRYRSNVLAAALCAVPAIVLSIAAVWFFKTRGGGVSLADVRIAAFYAPQIIVGLVLAVLVFVRGRFTVRMEHWRYALRFSLPLIPHLLSMYVLSQCDRLMIKGMCGPEQAAVFSLAVTLQYVLYVVIDSVEGSWVPWLFERLSERDAAGDGAASRRSIEKPFDIMLFAACGLALALALAAPELILLLGGAAYSEACYIVAPLLTCTLFAFLSRLYVSMEKYNKKTGLTALCTVLAAALNVPLNYLFIKRFGYIAAAYTTAFCYMLLFLAHAAVVKLVLKERCFAPAKQLAAALVCGGLCMAVIPLYGAQWSVWPRWGLIIAALGFCAVRYRGALSEAWAKIKNISSKSSKIGQNPR